MPPDAVPGSPPGAPADAPPPPLLIAASVTALEGVLLVALAVFQLAVLSASRVTMGVSTAAFFLVWAALLVVCALSLRRARSWARAPVVLTQLVALGVAWSFRGGHTTTYAVLIAVLAIATLVGMFHPATLHALEPPPEED